MQRIVLNPKHIKMDRKQCRLSTTLQVNGEIIHEPKSCSNIESGKGSNKVQ